LELGKEYDIIFEDKNAICIFANVIKAWNEGGVLIISKWFI